MQGEVGNEMPQRENDQQIDWVFDREEDLTHHNRLVIHPILPVFTPHCIDVMGELNKKLRLFGECPFSYNVRVFLKAQ